MKQQNGFTLIEVLVTMAVVALISLALSGALRFGVQAWRAGSNTAHSVERVVTVQNFLRRQINAAVLQPRFGREDPAQALLEDLRQRFIFSALVPTQTGNGGFYRFEIFLREQQLMLSWLPYNAGPALTQDIDQRGFVLLENVKAVEFSYTGNVEIGGEVVWQNDWKGDKKLPKLIRLKLQFDDDSGMFWPTFVAKTYVEELTS